MRAKETELDFSPHLAMENDINHTNTPLLPPSMYGALLIGGLLVLVFVFKRKQEQKKSGLPEEECEKDHVYLHQVGKGPYAPSLTPFAVKLETFLRITKTPYTNIHDKKLGPKGKVPWIEYNGVSMGDSQLCIEFLKKTRDVKINDGLTEEQKGVCRAVQKMVDEHTYWIMVQYRWVDDSEKDLMKLAKWRWHAIKLVSYIARKQTYYQGIGRHSPEEVASILRGDFRALSQILGDKDYMFGDSPTEIDCSVFGQLSQFLWHLPHTDTADMIKNDFNSLYRYCLRIKENYWPDWDNCVLFSDSDNIQQNQ